MTAAPMPLPKDTYLPAPDILYDEDGRFIAIKFELVDSPRDVFREAIDLFEYLIDDMGYYTDDDVCHIRLSSYTSFVRGIKPTWYRRAEDDDERLSFGINTWIQATAHHEGRCFEFGDVLHKPKLDARFIKYWGVPE